MDVMDRARATDIRALFVTAAAVYVVTVVIGILNGLDLVEFEHNVLMTHGAVAHGARVGNYVLLGINCVLLDNALVGNYCLVGAGAVVRSGARIPDHSLVVGVPGRVLPLTPEQKASLIDPTAMYVRNARRFIDAGLGLQIPK